MNERFDHLAFGSFYLWLDNYLAVRGGCWANQTGQFYNYTDPKVGSVFGSSYPQFIYDSDVVGANIVTGVYLNSNFVGRGTSGVKIDYLHGRVFANNTPIVTGSFAIKEFALYKNNQNLEVLVDKAYSAYKERYSKPKSYVDPNALIVPFINIVPIKTVNSPFAFGGEDETKIQLRATIVTDNSYKLDGILGLLRDARYVCLPYINNSQSLPFTYYNDLKSGSFSYQTHIRDTFDSELFIDRVAATKVSEVENDNGDLFHFGYAEFDILSYRYPRQ